MPDRAPTPPRSDLSRRLAEDIVFVLVEPQQPGNVGGVARAMANFGLRRLVLVNPAPSFDPERARWMAPGAHDVLDHLRIVRTLDEALQGVHRAVASTARHRRLGQPVRDPDETAGAIFDAPAQTTAILFGREDLGLSAEATSRCESLLRIPTAEHASLNLAMASTVVAQRLFESARARGMEAPGRPVEGQTTEQVSSAQARPLASEELADLVSIEPAVIELIALLNRVGHKGASRPDQLGVLVREAFQRAQLSQQHVGSLRGMVRRVEFALDHPEIPWRASRRQNAALRAVRGESQEE